MSPGRGPPPGKDHDHEHTAQDIGISRGGPKAPPSRRSAAAACSGAGALAAACLAGCQHGLMKTAAGAAASASVGHTPLPGTAAQRVPCLGRGKRALAVPDAILGSRPNAVTSTHRKRPVAPWTSPGCIRCAHRASWSTSAGVVHYSPHGHRCSVTGEHGWSTPLAENRPAPPLPRPWPRGGDVFRFAGPVIGSHPPAEPARRPQCGRRRSRIPDARRSATAFVPPPSPCNSQDPGASAQGPRVPRPASFLPQAAR